MLSVGEAVIAVLLAAVLAAHVGRPRPGTAPQTTLHIVPFGVSVDEYGVRLAIRVWHDEPRSYVSGALMVCGSANEGVTFWSERYDDVQPPPDPFPSRPGEKIVIESGSDPRCEGGGDTPAIVVRSTTTDGSPRVDEYRPASTVAYREAVETWQTMGPTVVVAGSRQDVGGAFTVTLALFNPTDEAITIESAAMVDGVTEREAASVVVPPHSRGELVLSGHGEGSSPHNPWTTGRVTIDGVPAELEEWESEQC